MRVGGSLFVPLPYLWTVLLLLFAYASLCPIRACLPAVRYPERQLTAGSNSFNLTPLNLKRRSRIEDYVPELPIGGDVKSECNTIEFVACEMEGDVE